jgi:hypothetical protein
MILRNKISCIFIALLFFGSAQADDFYVGSLTEMTNAFHSSDASTMTMGTGGTIGFKAYGGDFAGDVLNMGEHRLAFAARAGKQFEYGRNWRFNFGLYTGPKVHVDPHQDVEPVSLSQQTSLALRSSGIDSTMIEDQFGSTLQSEQATVSKLAVGWNLAEAQLKFERRLVKHIVLGLSGSAAYHVMLNGADAIAFTRKKALDRVDSDLDLSAQDPSIKGQIQNDVGARSLGWNDLGGVNYRASLYLTLNI